MKTDESDRKVMKRKYNQIVAIPSTVCKSAEETTLVIQYVVHAHEVGFRQASKRRFESSSPAMILQATDVSKLSYK